MEFKDLALLKKHNIENAKLYSLAEANFDINNLASKIMATKAAKINVLRLKKTQKTAV